jgi:hypothetical protein
MKHAQDRVQYSAFVLAVLKFRGPLSIALHTFQKIKKCVYEVALYLRLPRNNKLMALILIYIPIFSQGPMKSQI